MSQFYEYNWPLSGDEDVVRIQTFGQNVPLHLSGPYYNHITKTVNFSDFGIVQRIVIDSGADITDINFLITGYQNGVFISETLAGPVEIGTVTSVNCFDTILQIIPSGTSISQDYWVQVTTASIGYFPLIPLNMDKNTSSINYALNIVAAPTNPATYQVFLSLKNNLGGRKYDDLITIGDFVAVDEVATASALIQYNSLASNLLIKIGPNNDGSVLKVQFLQL